eukprot:TRINITY_DN13978_c0_g1_i2.p1 TRINITY_DN13978_c0_g1~~TRINITY_DN13978_c0_g1_i2.p1  ORF type:complete len:164 (+),score=26.09 TRINITY_DN13978_c0_g1_i2:3-494(+)
MSLEERLKLRLMQGNTHAFEQSYVATKDSPMKSGFNSNENSIGFAGAKLSDVSDGIRVVKAKKGGQVQSLEGRKLKRIKLDDSDDENNDEVMKLGSSKHRGGDDNFVVSISQEDEKSNSIGFANRPRRSATRNRKILVESDDDDDKADDDDYMQFGRTFCAYG